MTRRGKRAIIHATPPQQTDVPTPGLHPCPPAPERSGAGPARVHPPPPAVLLPHGPRRRHDVLGDPDMMRLQPENDQAGAIYYENGYENLLLSVSLDWQQQGNRSVSIFPVPPGRRMSGSMCSKDFPRMMGPLSPTNTRCRSVRSPVHRHRTPPSRSPPRLSFSRLWAGRRVSTGDLPVRPRAASGDVVVWDTGGQARPENRSGLGQRRRRTYPVPCLAKPRASKRLPYDAGQLHSKELLLCRHVSAERDGIPGAVPVAVAWDLRAGLFGERIG